MKPNFPYNKLARYFAGECTDRERADIEAWIAADSDREDLIVSLRQIWKKAGLPAGQAGQGPAAFDADKLSRGVFAKADLNPAYSPAKDLKPKAPDSRPLTPDFRSLTSDLRPLTSKRDSSLKYFLRIAAVIVMLIGVSYVVYRSTVPTVQVQTETVRQFTSRNGERAQFKLSDGTRVWLNAAGTIRFSLEPGSSGKPGRREVTLEGEAYFEVARNESVPFVVRTSKAVVEVLGTEFNVRAYQGEGDVEVAVAGGRVAVKATSESSEPKASKEILLVKGELSRVTADGDLEAPQQVDVEKYTAWVKGKLLFDKTPLSEVAVQLERWYDIKCVLGDASIATRHLTATFEREPLAEVVEVIASAANLRAEWKGNQVTLYDWAPKELVR